MKKQFIGVMVIVLLVISYGTSFAEKSEVTDDDLRKLELFTGVLTEIRQNYVDEVDMTKLMYGAIKGMLSTLDPHSTFMSPEDYAERKIDTKGEFGGLGIEISIRASDLIIVSPIEDTPAFRAGLQPGDHIVKIEDQSTQEMTILEAISLMRGKKGESITISVMRDSFERPQEFTLIRETIKLRSVKGKMLMDGYAVFRISQFQDRTSADLQKSINKLEKENAGPLKGLILDLRNNPGGLLDEAIAVSDLFLDDELIVFTKGREPESRIDFRASADSDSSRIDSRVIVLINGGSASASEIVAGALQDNNRAIIAGLKSFGKGSVQTLMPLNDDSGLSLTTALYYTPSGRSIQARGITPDIAIEQVAVQATKGARRLRESDLKNHFDPQSSESGVVAETEPTFTPDDVALNDHQLMQALNILVGADLLNEERQKSLTAQDESTE